MSIARPGRLLLLLLSLAPGLANASSTPDVDDVIAKHVRAMGGDEAWKQVRSYRSTARLVLGPGLEAPLETTVTRDGKVRVQFEFQGQQGVQAYDGEHAWWVSPFSGAPDPTAAPDPVAASLRRTADIDGPLIGWKSSGHRVRLVGPTELDGHGAIELEIGLATGETMRYLLDAETHLPLQAEIVEDGWPVSRFSDWREVGGLMVPFKIETRTARGPQTTTVATWEWNVETDDALFAMPAETTPRAGKEIAPSTAGVRVATLATIDAGSGGIELDAAGNVYSADFGRMLGNPGGMGTKVWRIDPGGEATVLADGLEGASGNAFDSKGNLFQSNIRGNRISKISPDGEVATFVEEGIQNPVGIAIDGKDTLFVANCGSASIQRVDCEGNSSRFVENPLLACPNGITMDPEGNLYTANFMNGDVVKITPQGEVSRLATLPGNNNGHVEYRDGRLWVVARSAHRIYALSLEGEYSLVAGSGGRGNDDGAGESATFCFPNDIAVSPDARTLYVNEVADCTADSRQLAPTRIRRIELGGD